MNPEYLDALKGRGELRDQPQRTHTSKTTGTPTAPMATPSGTVRQNFVSWG